MEAVICLLTRNGGNLRAILAPESTLDIDVTRYSQPDPVAAENLIEGF